LAKKKKVPKGHPLGKMVRWLDLPEYAGGTGECIEVLGRNTVRVEGAGGVHTYESDTVKIAMGGYRLVLHGCDFDLAQFSDGVLQVSGKLKNICWEVD
jgi:sporulation protein YqfC